MKNIKEMFKNEIASELGIELGADQTSRNNGRVGGTMVKRLIQLGEIKLEEEFQKQMNTKEIENKNIIEVPNYIIEGTRNDNELMH